MKKILGLILVSALLWSCGSQFSRSKYDRHMWNRSQGKMEKELKSTDEEAKSDVSEKTFSAGNETASVQTVINDDSQKLDEQKSITTIENKIERKKISTQSVKKQNHIPTTGLVKMSNSKKNSLKKKILALNSRIHPGNPTNGGGDANLILLVILAIILPPLGVYLKDGGVTGLFWLTLIFCLVGGGGIFRFGFYFGGLWGLAVILALLRVFDVI